MPLEEILLETVRKLPANKQQEVLDFAQFLAAKNGHKKPLFSLKGLWANLDIEISNEDIDDARRDMWSNFPREDF